MFSYSLFLGISPYYVCLFTLPICNSHLFQFLCLPLLLTNVLLLFVFISPNNLSFSSLHSSLPLSLCLFLSHLSFATHPYLLFYHPNNSAYSLYPWLSLSLSNLHSSLPPSLLISITLFYLLTFPSHSLFISLTFVFCNSSLLFVLFWPLFHNATFSLSIPVWPDWAIYWTLGHFLKPLATINLPKSLTFLGIFL